MTKGMTNLERRLRLLTGTLVAQVLSGW